MFRIEFLVDDKNLATVMHALAGLARDLNVLPVAGTNPLNGTKPKQPNQPRHPKSGRAHELLIDYMHNHNLTEITGGQAREIIGKLGLAQTSYSHYINNAVARGLIKKGPKVLGGPGNLWRLVPSKDAK